MACLSPFSLPFLFIDRILFQRSACHLLHRAYIMNILCAAFRKCCRPERRKEWHAAFCRQIQSLAWNVSNWTNANGKKVACIFIHSINFSIKYKKNQLGLNFFKLKINVYIHLTQTQGKGFFLETLTLSVTLKWNLDAAFLSCATLIECCKWKNKVICISIFCILNKFLYKIEKKFNLN